MRRLKARQLELELSVRMLKRKAVRWRRRHRKLQDKWLQHLGDCGVEDLDLTAQMQAAHEGRVEILRRLSRERAALEEVETEIPRAAAARAEAFCLEQ